MVLIKTIEARLATAIDKLEKDILTPIRTNNDKVLAAAFIWSYISRRAKNAKETADKHMATVFFIDKEKLDTGNHELAQSPHFTLEAQVSKPYTSFDPNVFAKKLSESKYKVPIAFCLELMNESKVDGARRVTYKVEERNA